MGEIRDELHRTFEDQETRIAALEARCEGYREALNEARLIAIANAVNAEIDSPAELGAVLRHIAKITDAALSKEE